MDLHSRNEESVDRVYSVEDVTRYLMFARQFKPKVTFEVVNIDNENFVEVFTYKLTILQIISLEMRCFHFGLA